MALCGDAHLSNFGIFAAPERNVVFDINDFGETYPGPWEWDVKRLAASAAVAGRGNGFDNKTCRKLASLVARAYRSAMQVAARKTILDVWYYRVDASEVVRLFDQYARTSAREASKTVKKATSQTSGHTIEKLTLVLDGHRQIINNPPLIVRFSQLFTEEQKVAAREQGDVERVWQDYLASLPAERRLMLGRYRIADAALRVGGIGSVGTRCAIALLQGDGPEDALILQQKEAGPSALASYLPRQAYENEAQRVVVGQHLIQAASDIFLGWHADSSGRHFYWRQLKDMKSSFDVTRFGPDGFATYLGVCAVSLARAHARSGDPVAISSYLGPGAVFDDAIGEFAILYADQTERDYRSLVEAVKRGQVIAETGV